MSSPLEKIIFTSTESFMPSVVEELSPGQHEFVHGNPQAQFRLALAGRQGGKTQIGCQEFARELMTNYNEYFMLVAPTFKVLNQASKEKLKDVLDHIYPKQSDGKGWIVKWDTPSREEWKDRNGNTIYLRSCKDPNVLRGPTLKAVFFDEAALVPTPDAFRILKVAVAVKGGRIYMTTTPYGPNWLLREVIKPFQAGDPRYHMAKWRSIDNPSFPMEEYEDAVKHLDERWVKQEYDAEIQGFGGLVFGEFDEETHVGLPEYDPSLPVYWGMDFGIANPTYIGYFQIVPPSVSGDVHINMIDELQLKDYKLPDVLDIALEKPYHRPALVMCDPTGSHRQSIAGIGADVVMFSEPYFLPVRYEKNWNSPYVRQVGMNEMHMLLKTNRITFHRDNCWNMIRAFGLYSRKAPEEGKRADERPIKDGVSDHPMESTFYFLLGRPRFFLTEKEEEALYDGYEPSHYTTGF